MRNTSAEEEDRRPHFVEKRDQLTALADRPVAFFWGKWPGHNIVALTRADEFTRPTFVIVAPDGRTTAFVGAIETSQFNALKGLVDVIEYEDTGELKEAVLREFPAGTPLLIETSDLYWSLDVLPPSYHRWLSENYPVSSAGDVLLHWRGRKTPAELRVMKRAALATLETFNEIKELIKPNVKEAEILEHLFHSAISKGGAPAFYPIVAAGPRSRNPHPVRRTDNALRAGDRLIVDFGVKLDGYCADITRTFIVGGNPEDDPYFGVSREIGDFVRSADLGKYTLRGFAAAITELVKGHGYAGLLRHGHGHGLGVETHDPHPYITDKEGPRSDDPFQDGMVFTIEPGFYDEKGGFRIEDDYAILSGRAVPLQEIER